MDALQWIWRRQKLKQIQQFLTKNLSIIFNNASSNEKVFWSESGEKSAQIKHGYYYGLWTCIWVKNILMMDLFHLLSSPDVNWWTGVLRIIVMFLSALILTAPIHCRASIAETLMQNISPNLMKKNSSTSWMSWGWTHFSTFSFLAWTIYLIYWRKWQQQGIKKNLKYCVFLDGHAVLFYLSLFRC